MEACERARDGLVAERVPIPAEQSHLVFPVRGKHQFGCCPDRLRALFTSLFSRADVVPHTEILVRLGRVREHLPALRHPGQRQIVRDELVQEQRCAIEGVGSRIHCCSDPIERRCQSGGQRIVVRAPWGTDGGEGTWRRERTQCDGYKVPGEEERENKVFG